jgi:GNAT superfamily N-acetyltransferase
MLHKNEYVQMSKDYMIWVLDELDAHFGINSRSYIEMPFDEWLEGIVDPFEKLVPPNGSLYMAMINGEVVGMGAIKKLSHTVGEIKRMYNKPEYRGLGIGRAMIDQLLSDGKQFGCKTLNLIHQSFR